MIKTLVSEEKFAKKTIKDVDVAGKRVLVRADFNVPLNNGVVADDTRIHAALPTMQYLIDRGARTILCSHLGRPKGKIVDELRLDPVAKRLSEFLGRTVTKLDDCIGPEVEDAVERMKPGEVLLLENTRFHKEERENDPGFAAQLAKLADLYVNDAFGSVHRAHASTEGVTHYLPSVAGFLIEREVNALERVLKSPEHPFAAIFGGIKISDKISAIKQLDQVDILLAGGGMAYTLLKAKGIEIGQSPINEESLEIAQQVIDDVGEKLVLPVDVAVADAMDAKANWKIVSIDKIPSEWYIMDVGPQTVDLFQEKLRQAKMVIWNGPLGAFEIKPFQEGTYAIARSIAELDAVTIIGGGDLAAAVQEAGVADKMSHVSTGGGAFLDYLAGKVLPGIETLQEKCFRE
ncbi:MAG: phosphoglycerate kinase [wastewater metagenome]|nr:phosphoglycerate kinase [Candidatus Loosdrechtia aerotolerans]